MEQNTQQRKFKRLVAEDKLEELVDMILSYGELNEGKEEVKVVVRKALQVKGALNRLNSQLTDGVIDYKEANLERNRISSVLVTLIEELQKVNWAPAVLVEQRAANNVTDIPKEKFFTIPRRWYTYFVFIVIFSILGLGLDKLKPVPELFSLPFPVQQKLGQAGKAILRSSFAEAEKHSASALTLGESALDSIHVIGSLTELYLEKEEYDRAYPLIERSLDIAGREELPLYLMKAENDMGEALMGEGELEEGKKHLLLARKQAGKITEKTTETKLSEARTSLLLADYHLREKTFSSAQHQLEQAVKLVGQADTNHPEYHFLSGEIQFSFGHLFQERGETAKAKEYYEKSILSFERQLKYWEEGDTPTQYFPVSRLAKAYNNLANLNKQNAKLRQSYLIKAEDYYRQLEEVGFDNFLDETAKVKYNIATFLYQEGKLEKALVEYESLLAVFKVLNEVKERNYDNAIAICYNAIGGIHIELGEKNYPQALRHFHTSRQIREKLFSAEGEDFRDALPAAYYNLGEAYNLSEKPDSARIFYEKAIENYNLVYSKNKQRHYYHFANALFSYSKLLGMQFREQQLARVKLKKAYEILYENGPSTEEQWKVLTDSIEVYRKKFSGG